MEVRVDMSNFKNTNTIIKNKRRNAKENTYLTELSKPIANLDFHLAPSYHLLGKQKKTNRSFRKTYSRIFLNTEQNV